MQPSANARSPWVRGRTPTAGPLEGNASADVCVVGAGVAGLTAGLLLARGGRSVILLDEEGAADVGAVTTNAHLMAGPRVVQLARLHGGKKARMVLDSLEKAIGQVEEICRSEGIPGFRRVNGYLICDAQDDVQTLIKELKALQAAGLEVRLDPGAPLPFETGPALVLPDQAEVDAGAYVTGLADAFVRAGGIIFSDSPATGLVEGDRPVVETQDGQVECAVIILASDSPSIGRVDLAARQVPHWRYGCAYSVPRDSVRRGLYWETGPSSHAVRLADQTDVTDLLIVDGEDHPADDAVDPDLRFDDLDAWVRARFPVGAPAFRWVGQVMRTMDHLPFLGLQTRRSTNVYAIAGYSAQEIPYATAGAMIVADLIEGRFNICSEAFHPYRHAIQATASRVTRKVKAAVADAMVDVTERPRPATQPMAVEAPIVASGGGEAAPPARSRPRPRRAPRKVTVFRAPGAAAPPDSRAVPPTGDARDEPATPRVEPRRRLGVH